MACQKKLEQNSKNSNLKAKVIEVCFIIRTNAQHKTNYNLFDFKTENLGNYRSRNGFKVIQVFSRPIMQ